jgi:hypothetical protein
MRPAFLAAGLLASVALLSACGSSKSSSSQELSSAQTRAAIEESILRERHIRATVTCPARVLREKGVTFRCLAVSASGARTTFHVIEVNDRGAVRYSSPPAPPPTVE